MQWQEDKQMDEAYVNLDIKFPQRPGIHSLKLKIDTGAQVNTLPYRILQNMYPQETDKHLHPTRHTLSAYNNTRIDCKVTIPGAQTDSTSLTFQAPQCLGYPAV